VRPDDSAPSLRRAELAAVAGVVLFALSFAAVAAWSGGRQSWDIVQRVPMRIVPVLLALSLVNYVMRGGRWLLFSDGLRLGVPAASSMLYYVSGFAMTATPGKMGEVVRLYLLKRFHGCAYARTAPLLIADRLSDGIATTLVVALTLVFYAHYPAGVASAAVFALCLVAVCLRPDMLLPAIGAVFARVRRWPRVFVRARRAVRGLRALSSPRVFASALVFGAIGWTAEGLGLFVLVHSLGVTLRPAACIFIFAFSMLVGAASVLPGGLGSTEATMVGLLTLQGVHFKTALVATGLIRITTLWFAVGLGLLALPVALSGVGRRAVPVG
jgi:uncharacterized protein (TIRG00374 family)